MLEAGLLMGHPEAAYLLPLETQQRLIGYLEFKATARRRPSSGYSEFR
jgi:hypothetical protein